MYEFNYQRANSVDQAVKALKGAGDGKFLAGGMTLLPTLKLRLAQPSDIVDLAGIQDLKGIRHGEGDKLIIGALTTHVEVTASGEVQRSIPALATLARWVGDSQVRNRGTLGGSIANADPAADYPAAIVGLRAKIRTNTREINADDFFTGMFETALADDELITEVDFPIPKRAGYVKYPNPASRYAIVGVMVAETARGMRVAVTGAGPSVFRVRKMEQALDKKFAPEALDGITIPADDLSADMHASAEYRAHLVTVIAKRAVTAAIG